MITVRLLLAPDDLTRIRVHPTADVMSEVQGAAGRLGQGRSVDAVALGWARRSAQSLGPKGALVMDVMRSGLVSSSDLGQHDVRFPSSFDEFADGIRRTPQSLWRSEVYELIEWGFEPGPPAIMCQDRTQIPHFAEVLGYFHDAAIRPYWTDICLAAQAAGDMNARLFATRGVDELLNGLSPDITWTNPVLTIQINDRFCTGDQESPQVGFQDDRNDPALAGPGGRGLVLIPTVLGTRVEVWVPEDSDEPTRPWELTYPVPVDWSFSVPGPNSALADLLGVTRAAVLETLVGRVLSTSELAISVHVAPATASEHAAVLRVAGLLTSTRVKNRVNHELTPMGVALARARRGVPFVGAAVQQVFASRHGSASASRVGR